jgi:hypothetical protein
MSRWLPIDGSWVIVITGLNPVKGPYLSPLELSSVSFSIYQMFMEDEYPTPNYLVTADRMVFLW